MTEAGTPIAFEFVDLTGTTPPEIGLPPLPSMVVGLDALRQAFGALTPDAPGHSPCVVVYAAGHAWVGSDGMPTASLRLDDGTARLLNGADLVAVAKERAAGRSAIVVLDVCHSRAFEDALEAAAWKPWAVVFASASDQPASAFLIDKATRLMTALSRQLATNKPVVDLDDVLERVGRELGRADVISPQTVEVYRYGPRLRLLRRDRITNGIGGVTVSSIRAGLLSVGALLAIAAIFGGWFYVTHAWIELDLGDLASRARGVQVVVTTEQPRDNVSTEASRDAVQGHVFRVRVLASDIIVRVTATYDDGQPRTLNFPLLLSPGIGWDEKYPKLKLPPVDQVLAHPRMAYIPPESWVDEPGKAPRDSRKPFWIDLYPLTVKDYEPLLRTFLADGRLLRDQSVLAQLVSAQDLNGVGGEKVGELAEGLAPILNIVKAAGDEHPVEDMPVVPRLAAKPCDTCGAPVSYTEAVLYCKSRHARVPTFEELELAGRGVDGRRFPWGDRFDNGRANAPGLPEKGGPPPAMKPVDTYPNGQSPFGVLDVVGDAGKWVAQDDNSYPTYIGASFRQSGDEVEPFARIPYVEGTSIPEISVRCVEG